MHPEAATTSLGRLLPVGPRLCKRSFFACSRRADGGAARGGGGGRRVCGNISGLALDRAGQEVSLAGSIKISRLRILGNGQCGRWLQAVISAAAVQILGNLYDPIAGQLQLGDGCSTGCALLQADRVGRNPRFAALRAAYACHSGVLQLARW